MVEKAKNFYERLDQLTKVFVFMLCLTGLNAFVNGYYVSQSTKNIEEKLNAMEQSNKTTNKILVNQYFLNKGMIDFFQSESDKQKDESMKDILTYLNINEKVLFYEGLSFRGAKQNN